MRRRVRKATRGPGPPSERPLGSDIVALLGRALREEEYSTAEQLLQALEELEKGIADSGGRERCSHELDIAYLEIARTLRTDPRIGVGGRSDVEPPSRHRRDKQ